MLRLQHTATVPLEPPTSSMCSDQVLQIIKRLQLNRHQCLLQRSAFKMSIKQLLKKELNIFICVFEDSFIGTMSEREQSEEMGIFQELSVSGVYTCLFLSFLTHFKIIFKFMNFTVFKASAETLIIIIIIMSHMFHMHRVYKHVYKHTQQHPENRVAYLFVMLNVTCSAVNPCREHTNTHKLSRLYCV